MAEGKREQASSLKWLGHSLCIICADVPLLKTSHLTDPSGGELHPVLSEGTEKLRGKGHGYRKGHRIGTTKAIYYSMHRLDQIKWHDVGLSDKLKNLLTPSG